MKSHLELMQHILDNGVKSDDRTGVGTIATFGEQVKYNLLEGFPAQTTKKLAFKSVVAELLWFIRGSTNLEDLRAITHGEEHRGDKQKKTIWDANYEQQGEKELGYTNGYCGQVYGAQWRGYGLTGAIDGDGYYWDLPQFDQVKAVIEEAQKNPNSRRLLVEAWNPQLVWDNPLVDGCLEYVQDKPILPPCHTGFQINIQGDYIDLLFKMRSLDVFLGKGFDEASYAILTHIFGRILNKTPRTLVGQFGNTHIYLNHIEQVKEQLSREPYPLPQLWINPELKTLEDFENATIDDFKLIGYQHHPAIKAPMAV